MNKTSDYILFFAISFIGLFTFFSCNDDVDNKKQISFIANVNSKIIPDSCLKQKSDSIKSQMKEYENILVMYHILLIDNEFETRVDPAANFERQLTSILKDPNTFKYNFDSLSQRISIKKSKDGLIKTYSWDEYSGGTWHDMACYIQFKIAEDSVGLKKYDTDQETKYSEFTDVIIYQINEIEIDSATHYILFGWGTHGAGHKHATIKIGRIENNLFVFCDNIINNSDELVIEAARTEDLGLEFDSITHRITHNEFWNDHGFQRETGGRVTWELKKDKYVKISNKE